MFELGIGMILFGSVGIGIRLSTKYKFSLNKIKQVNSAPSIEVKQENITKEDELSIKQHFNILKLITNRRKNSIPKDKED